MQGLVAEATLERKLRLLQDVCSNGFKVVAGRKNIGHIGHGQRDRFLDTEALAEERKRGADTEEWFISWGIGQMFFRANACRWSEVDRVLVMVEVAWPFSIHTEVHPPATKSVIVAVHEFFFTAIGRLRQMVASGKGAQQEGGEEHHGQWRGTIYFDCWGLGIPKSTIWEEYSNSIFAYEHDMVQHDTRTCNCEKKPFSIYIYISLHPYLLTRVLWLCPSSTLLGGGVCLFVCCCCCCWGMGGGGVWEWSAWEEIMYLLFFLFNKKQSKQQFHNNSLRILLWNHFGNIFISNFPLYHLLRYDNSLVLATGSLSSQSLPSQSTAFAFLQMCPLVFLSLSFRKSLQLSSFQLPCPQHLYIL